MTERSEHADDRMRRAREIPETLTELAIHDATLHAALHVYLGGRTTLRVALQEAHRVLTEGGVEWPSDGRDNGAPPSAGQVDAVLLAVAKRAQSLRDSARAAEGDPCAWPEVTCG